MEIINEGKLKAFLKKESERLGIKKCIIPENNKKLLKNSYKLDIIGVKNINEALKAIGIFNN